MLFGNTPKRSLSWIALLLGAAALAAGQPAIVNPEIAPVTLTFV